MPLVFDAPEVGQSLIEHRAILMSWQLGKPLSQNPSFGGWRLLRSVGKYFFSRSGPMAAATYAVGTWWKSRPDLARPDLQFIYSKSVGLGKRWTLRLHVGGSRILKK